MGPPWLAGIGVLFLSFAVTVDVLAPASRSQQSTSTMIVGTPTTDSSGVEYFPVSSVYQGNEPQTIRVLEPSHPAAGQPRRILFVLPVNAGYDAAANKWGDGLEALRLLNVQNRFNVTLIAPSFDYEPWYGDNTSDETRRMESFIVDDLVPFSNSFARGQVPQRYLIGFSKSGLGALFLILRHPAIFNGAAIWDIPAQLKDINNSRISSPGALQMNFGTQPNFNQYNILSLLQSNGEPFRHQNRLWIGEDHAIFTSQMDELHRQMMAASIEHTWSDGSGSRVHRWDGGWLQDAVSSLMTNAKLTIPDEGTLPPARTGGLPFGTLHSGSTQTLLILDTDRPASCRYATVAGTPFRKMTHDFVARNGTSQVAPIEGLRNGSRYSYYVRCIDKVTQAVDSTDYLIGFSVAASGSGCGNPASGVFAAFRDPLFASLTWNTTSSLNPPRNDDGPTGHSSTRCGW